MAYRQTDFSGGMTDQYVDGPQNAAKKLDNILVNEMGRPVQRPGIDIFSALAPQIPPGNQAIDAMHWFDGVLFVKSGTKLYYLVDGGAAWVTLAGPTGNDAFADSELGAKASFSEWRGHLIITPNPGATKTGGCRTVKVYRDGTNAWKLVQAGLPSMTGSGVTTGGIVSSMTYTVGGVNTSYVWYYCFRRTYVAKVNGVNSTFEDIGAPEIYHDAGDPMGVSSSIINGSRSFANAAGENYDTATMVVRTYRTKGNGKRPYYVNDTAMGTNLADALADGALGAEAHAGMEYGNTNDPVPKCYFSFVTDQSGFFVAGVDTADNTLKTTRAWQSRPADWDSVPSGNFVEMEGSGAPTASDLAVNVPVVFFRNRAYRIEGRLDRSGAGSLRAVPISLVEGSVGPRVVRTDDGIVFASENGICFTDGYKVMNLTNVHLKKSFKALVVASLSGAFDSESGRVFLGIESSDLVPAVSGKNNAFWVLDKKHTSAGRGCVTTASADLNLQPAACHYDSKNKRLLIGDSRGYVFTFNAAKKADLVVNTATSPSTWSKKGIVWDIITCATSFGDSIVDKLLTRCFILAKNVSSQVSMDLSVYLDDGATDVSMKQVRERSVTAFLHRIWRWFPQGARRCTYAAQRAKKGFVVIARSDDSGLCTTNGAANTAVLAGGNWPTEGGEDLVGQSLYLVDDNYVASYVITVQSGDTLTVSDPGNVLPTGAGKKWIIKGYPKTEDLEIHAVTMDAEMLQGTDYKDVKATTSGGNT